MKILKKNLFTFKSLALVLALAFLLTPVLAFGLGPGSPSDYVPGGSEGLSSATDGGCFGIFSSNGRLDGLINYVSCIIGRSVVPLLFVLAFAMFFIGVLKYVLNPTDENKRAQGRQFMIWGIIALTVMFSVWGLVAILGGTFGIDTQFVPSMKQQGYLVVPDAMV